MTPQPGGRNGQLARLVWHLYCHDSMGQHMSWIASAPNEPCPACREEKMEQTRLLQVMSKQLDSIIVALGIVASLLIVLIWRSW